MSKGYPPEILSSYLYDIIFGLLFLLIIGVIKLDIKDLKQLLENKTCILNLNGLIRAEIIIDNTMIAMNENELIFKSNNDEKFIINKHQIMNIKHNSNGIISIYLDQLLSINILVK